MTAKNGDVLLYYPDNGEDITAHPNYLSRLNTALNGGAAANLLSRLLSGAVTDWIPLPFSGAFIPGGLFFNLADAEIACGAAAALLLL